MASFYLGMARGQGTNLGLVTAGTSTAGSAVDVEVRWSDANGLTRKDLNMLLDMIEKFVNSGGLNGAGANLPAR